MEGDFQNDKFMDKAVKMSIIFGMLIISLSVAYYLVIFLPLKEKGRLAEQQDAQQVKVQAEQLKSQEAKDQQKREYVSKRKTDCLQVYKTENDKWSNVESYEYNEKYDQCSVIYRDMDAARSESVCDNLRSNTIQALEGGSTIDGSSPQEFANELWMDCMNHVTRKKF